MTEADEAARTAEVRAAYQAREDALAAALEEYRRKVAEAEAELDRRLGPLRGA